MSRCFLMAHFVTNQQNQYVVLDSGVGKKTERIADFYVRQHRGWVQAEVLVQIFWPEAYEILIPSLLKPDVYIDSIKRHNHWFFLTV